MDEKDPIVEQEQVVLPATKEQSSKEDNVNLSLADIVEKLSEAMLTTQPRQEMAKLKALFYKAQGVLLAEKKQEWVAEGNEAEAFSFVFEEEAQMKAVFAQYKEKRAIELKVIEEEKQKNLALKKAIIAQLKELISTPDGVDKIFNQVKDLQEQWKSIGEISVSEYADMVRTYQSCIEQFYDFLKINKELRDYDFKKNLERKKILCDKVELLKGEEKVNLAFQQLQGMHAEWREIGPVAKEHRETLWERFKAASSIVNKNHADFYQKRKEEEEANLAKKIILCEQIEAFTKEMPKSYKEWTALTDKVIELQDQWKKIGYAPKKQNAKVYERFRLGCDTVFSRKSDFFKEVKSVQVANLELKKALVEKVDALKESNAWKETTEELIKLQKEWKTIGPVAKKHSDAIWKKFVTACDYFFEQKNLSFSNKKGEEQDNLAKKGEVVEQIAAYEGSQFSDLKQFIATYNAIGHVPFKEKDKIYKKYQKQLDLQFDRLKVGDEERKMSVFASSLEHLKEKGDDGLRRESIRLKRAYEAIQSDIKTRENNFGFLNIGSKGGSNPLFKEMEKNLERLKEEAVLIKKKIKMLNEAYKANGREND